MSLKFSTLNHTSAASAPEALNQHTSVGGVLFAPTRPEM